MTEEGQYILSPNELIPHLQVKSQSKASQEWASLGFYPVSVTWLLEAGHFTLWVSHHL